MGMTITEKILAAHATKEKVNPGDIIEARVDLVMSNDITAPLAIKELRRCGIASVFNPKKICMVLDHCAPARDINSAEACKLVREFAGQNNLHLIFDVGRMGIEHALLPDEGLTAPGELIVGGDSHTCTYGALGAFSTGMGSTDIAAAMALGKVWLRVPETVKCVFDGDLQEYVTGKDLILYLIGQYGVDGAQYKSLEIVGNTISKLGMDDRFTICNMAIEAGAKNGIIPPDDTSIDYMNGRTERPFNCYNSDVDAAYHQVWNFKVAELTPLVARPFSPGNVSAVAELEHTRVDQVVIGCCTNGRINDLRRAAKILNGRKISKKVRTIVIPATQAIYKQSMKEGLLDIFIDSGAAVSTPSCGPCAGLHGGVLADGEVCLSTTNRNFRGRMGSAGSKVYLANPYIAAATAIAGFICEPKEVV